MANDVSSLGQPTDRGRFVQVSGQSNHGSEEVTKQSKSAVGSDGGVDTISVGHNLQFIRWTTADGRLGEQKSHVQVPGGMVEGDEHRRDGFLPREQFDRCVDTSEH